jgi:hypothetical protein
MFKGKTFTFTFDLIIIRSTPNKVFLVKQIKFQNFCIVIMLYNSLLLPSYIMRKIGMFCIILDLLSNVIKKFRKSLVRCVRFIFG